jgi:hypothetical protein
MRPRSLELVPDPDTEPNTRLDGLSEQQWKVGCFSVCRLLNNAPLSFSGHRLLPTEEKRGMGRHTVHQDHARESSFYFKMGGSGVRGHQNGRGRLHTVPCHGGGE